MANGESEFGLDYGPAPLDREKALAAGKRKGKPVSEEQLDFVSGTSEPVPARSFESNAAADLAIKEQLRQTANLKATELLNAKPIGFEETPRGFIKDMVVNRGRTIGEAIDIINQLYSEGHPYIHGLPGIDEFIDASPGTLELSVDKFVEGSGEPVARALSGAAWLSKILGGPEFTPPIASEDIDFYNKVKQEVRPSNTTSDIVGVLPGLAAAGLLETAAIPVLTRGAAAVAGGAATRAAVGAVRGGGVLQRGVVEAAGAERLARWVGRGAATATGAAGYDLMYGHDPTLESVGASLALTAGGGWLLRKISKRRVVDSAFEYVSRATGVPVEDLTRRVTNAEQMLQLLTNSGAPSSFMSRFVLSGSKTYGKTFGSYLGRWAAKSGKSVEDFDALIAGVDNAEFLSAARKGYESSTEFLGKIGGQTMRHRATVDYLRSFGADDSFLDSISANRRAFSEGAAKYFGRKIAQTGEDPKILGELTKYLRPKYYKIAIDEYNNFLDEAGFAGQAVQPKLRWEAMQHFRGPVTKPANTIDFLVAKEPINQGGAKIYYPLFSKWHLNNVVKGNTTTVVQRFKNPLYVKYADNQMPAYAAISHFQGNQKIAAAVLQKLDYLVQNRTGIDQSTFSNIAENAANRMAKRFGYDSIIYQGSRPDKARYVDIENIEPLEESAQKLVEEFEKQMQRAGRRAAGRNFLSVALPVSIAAAGVGLTAEESQGVTIPTKGIAQAIKKALPRSFTTLIDDLGKQVFGHELGVSAHRDILAKLGLGDTDDAVREAVKKGFVRGGRMAEGPFVEFNWDNEQARNRALAFVKENHAPGDIVMVDSHKEGRVVSFVGSLTDAEALIRTGEKAQRVSRIRDFLSIIAPVGVGLGALTFSDEPAEAMSFAPLKDAAKFASIREFAEGLEPKLAAIVKQAAAISGELTPKGVVNYLERVSDDIHNLKGKARVEPFNAGPMHQGVNVVHDDFGGFPLVNISGVVDPEDGTWYPQIRNSPLGFSKKALGKVFGEVKKANPEIRRLSSPKNLAGILLATAASIPVLDLFAPNEAGAIEFPTKPIVDLLSKGIRGAGDDILEDIARSKTADDVARAAFERAQQVRNQLSQKTFENTSIGDEQWLKFDTFGKLLPESNEMLGIADTGEGLNSAYRIRTPGNASDNPWWQGFYGRFVRLKNVLVDSDDSTVMRLRNRGEGILKAANLKEENRELLYRGLRGLRTTASGGVVQTDAAIPTHLDSVARQIHKEILDPLWQFNTGIDPRAVGILGDLGLEETRGNWELIKRIQLKEWNDPMPRGANAKHISAAQAMRGMLNTKPWQWRNLETPYSKARLLIKPVEQERAELVKLIQGFNTRYGQVIPKDVQIRKAMLERRLEVLNRLEKQGVRLPKMEYINRSRFQPFEDLTTGEIPLETQEKDLGKLLYRHIDGAVVKGLFDEMNAYAKVITDYFENTVDEYGAHLESRAVADYIKEFMNTVNGVKSLRGDTRLAETVNSILRPLTNKRVTIDQIRRIANGMLEFTYLTKLGMGLRFPLVNSTQPLQTTAMITGVRSLSRAYAKVMNDNGIWDEATAAGLVRSGTGRAMSDIEKLGNTGPIRKLLDWLPTKSENLNRVVSYQAGKDWALDQLAKTGTVKVPHFVRTFNRDVLSSGNADKISKEVGAAIARTTQFIFGPEGRPLVLSGGAARRVAFQFKSFTAGYVDLFVGAIEHGRRTGDWMPLTRGITAVTLFGGLGTILPYEMIRSEMVKRGYSGWPSEDQSGLGYLISAAASTFAQPETKDDLDAALRNLQIAGSYSVLNVPALGGEDFFKGLTQFALGPTLGPAAQIAASGLGYAQGKVPGEQALRQSLGAISPGPIGASGLEAVQMAGNQRINKVMSDLGYRGGIYSPTGKLLAKQQSTLGVISRAFNLQPSMRSQRYKFLRDIQNALEGGQLALARKIMNEANKQGFIITKDDFSRQEGRVTRRKNEKAKPNEPLR